MKKKRLIIVSNRLPFKITEKRGNIEFSPNAGGLVSSIQSYIEASGQGNEAPPIWIGTSDIKEEKLNKGAGGLVNEGFQLVPVFIPSAINDKFYNGLCNDTIWPLFHYFPSFAQFPDDTYDSYVKANQFFCDKIIENYKPTDIIWVHDYHLMLVPAMLRKRLPEATIGFFLHIPFPSFELFRLIPSTWRKEILNGLLGADLIGFHTNDYVQHFLKSIREILGFENKLRVINTPERSITVDTFPISIDFKKFSQMATENETFQERNRIKKKFYESKLIISVDRLDYAKGLVKRMECFELFLEMYPQYHGKVIYIMQVVPSRDIISKYKETKEQLQSLVSKINGRFGSIHWTPVIYQYKTLEFRKMIALYSAADIALITPMRDGMNLVAKEFVASRADKRGVLILSETTGAAAELGEAYLVNPTDLRDIAQTIALALELPVEEQVARNEVMQKRLQEYDVVKWAEDFLTQLEIKKRQQDELKIKEITPEVNKQIYNRYVSARTRLIFLDYDGTLTPLARLPHLAYPGKELLDLLKNLSHNKRNEVVIISGRSMETLEKWFGNISVNLVAEHGAFSKMQKSDWLQYMPVSVTWKNAVRQVMEMNTERCQGAFVEEKMISLAWHYRNAENELGFLRSRELINTLIELSADLDFQIIEGKKVIEVRPRGIHKGKAAETWINEKEWDFVIGIGDDSTDEDLFKSIPADQFSIRVGLTQSIAKYNLKQQPDVISLLNTFATSDA